MTNVKLFSRPANTAFNSLVNDFFSTWPEINKAHFNNSERKGWVPVNVKENENGYLLEVVAPGFEKNDFKVNLDGNLLTIAAEKAATDEQAKDKEIRREYSYRSFKRSFTLDEKIDATKIDASYINGVLTLNLPKKETVKPLATEIAIK